MGQRWPQHVAETLGQRIAASQPHRRRSGVLTRLITVTVRNYCFSQIWMY